MCVNVDVYALEFSLPPFPSHLLRYFILYLSVYVYLDVCVCVCVCVCVSAYVIEVIP